MEQLPAAKERKVVVWGNKFKPKCSGPSPLAYLRYSAKMSHRDLCSTFLCPQTVMQCSLCASSAARPSPWEQHRYSTSLSTNGLPQSHCVNNSSSGQASPTITERADGVCKWSPWKGSILQLNYNTKVFPALEIIGLNHSLNSVQSWRWIVPPECDVSIPLIDVAFPSFSRDAYSAPWLHCLSTRLWGT